MIQESKIHSANTSKLPTFMKTPDTAKSLQFKELMFKNTLLFVFFSYTTLMSQHREIKVVILRPLIEEMRVCSFKIKAFGVV